MQSLSWAGEYGYDHGLDEQEQTYRRDVCEPETALPHEGNQDQVQRNQHRGCAQHRPSWNREGSVSRQRHGLLGQKQYE
jgi:hypothetical protein